MALYWIMWQKNGFEIIQNLGEKEKNQMYHNEGQDYPKGS